MKTPAEILNSNETDPGPPHWITKKAAVDAMKEYAKHWIDQAAEVAMLQAEKGLPVGDAIFELKNQIDKALNLK